MAQETFAPSPTTLFRRADGTRVPVCSANAYGRIASEWGMESVPCTVTRGLRSFTDRTGIVRYYCGSLGHEANARRRFGQFGPGAASSRCESGGRFGCTCDVCF